MSPFPSFPETFRFLVPEEKSENDSILILQTTGVVNCKRLYNFPGTLLPCRYKDTLSKNGRD